MFRSQVMKDLGEAYRRRSKRLSLCCGKGWSVLSLGSKQQPFECLSGTRSYGDVVRYVSIWQVGGQIRRPYCLYAGGNVVNVAIELNGQPPLQVYIKPSDTHKIILRSIDLGAMEVILHGTSFVIIIR